MGGGAALGGVSMFCIGTGRRWREDRMEGAYWLRRGRGLFGTWLLDAVGGWAVEWFGEMMGEWVRMEWYGG